MTTGKSAMSPPRKVGVTTIAASAEYAHDRHAYPEDTTSLRPRTRAECSSSIRPCPFVSCSRHLFLDVDEKTGAITYNFPGLEPDELTETCAMDVARNNPSGLVLEDVGDLMNMSRERVRQLEDAALLKAKSAKAVNGVTLYDFAPETNASTQRKRRLPVIDEASLVRRIRRAS